MIADSLDDLLASSTMATLLLSPKGGLAKPNVLFFDRDLLTHMHFTLQGNPLKRNLESYFAPIASAAAKTQAMS